MKAIRYEKDTVLVQKGKIKAWVDVVVSKGELSYDWNKYIFFLNRKYIETRKNTKLITKKYFTKIDKNLNIGKIWYDKSYQVKTNHQISK